MESKIVGTVMPVLELSMQPNEKVFAESGQLAWMSMAMQMQTSTSAGGQQGRHMAVAAVNGTELYFQERGDGSPLLQTNRERTHVGRLADPEPYADRGATWVLWGLKPGDPLKNVLTYVEAGPV